MIKFIFAFCIIFIFINQGSAQIKLYRYLYRNEFSILLRTNNDGPNIITGLGYEWSINKNKTYFSIANEFSTQFYSVKNIGEQLITTLKVNFQNEHITSFGIGSKYKFNTNFTSLIATGGYKYDFFKMKLTLSANVLLEVFEGIKVGPNSPSLVCTGNCPKYLYRWHFGLAVGKYF